MPSPGRIKTDERNHSRSNASNEEDSKTNSATPQEINLHRNYGIDNLDYSMSSLPRIQAENQAAANGTKSTANQSMQKETRSNQLNSGGDSNCNSKYQARLSEGADSNPEKSLDNSGANIAIVNFNSSHVPRNEAESERGYNNTKESNLPYQNRN